jgi:hypothetical protein
MGFVSYWILRREHFFGRSKKIDELKPTFDEASQQLETQSHTEVIGTLKPNKSASNGGAKQSWVAYGIALSSIWTLLIIMGDEELFGYAQWNLFNWGVESALFAWLMGVGVSFIVAWVVR